MGSAFNRSAAVLLVLDPCGASEPLVVQLEDLPLVLLSNEHLLQLAGALLRCLACRLRHRGQRLHTGHSTIALRRRLGSDL